MDRKESDAFELPPLVETDNSTPRRLLAEQGISNDGIQIRHQPVKDTSKVLNEFDSIRERGYDNRKYNNHHHDNHHDLSDTSPLSTKITKVSAILQAARDFTHKLSPFHSIESNCSDDKSVKRDNSIHYKSIHYKSSDELIAYSDQQMQSISVKLKNKLHDADHIWKSHQQQESGSLKSVRARSNPHQRPSPSFDSLQNSRVVLNNEDSAISVDKKSGCQNFQCVDIEYSVSMQFELSS